MLVGASSSRFWRWDWTDLLRLVVGNFGVRELLAVRHDGRDVGKCRFGEGSVMTEVFLVGEMEGAGVVELWRLYFPRGTGDYFCAAR